MSLAQGIDVPRRGRVARIDAGFALRIERFLATARAAGLTHIREGEPDFASFAAGLERLLPREMPDPR